MEESQMRRAELRDVTCFAWLHWKLVCLWQFDSCFRFAVAASDIFTVISSNSSLISFWRSFRGIFWEVLWTFELTQINSVNGINCCVKFRKRNWLLVTFVAFFTALWTFWHLVLELSFILKNLYTFRTNIVLRSYRFGAYHNSHLVVLRSEVTFFSPFLV